jgi:hypothetical protein
VARARIDSIVDGSDVAPTQTMTEAAPVRFFMSSVHRHHRNLSSFSPPPQERNVIKKGQTEEHRQ